MGSQRNVIFHNEAKKTLLRSYSTTYATRILYFFYDLFVSSNILRSRGDYNKINSSISRALTYLVIPCRKVTGTIVPWKSIAIHTGKTGTRL